MWLRRSACLAVHCRGGLVRDRVVRSGRHWGGTGESRRRTTFSCVGSSRRSLVSSSGGRRGGDDDYEESDEYVEIDDYDEIDDPFGVGYEDGDENLGPESDLPPKYVRDPISGKWTGDTEKEPKNGGGDDKVNTKEEDESEILKRLMDHWGNSDDDNEKEDAVARRIREANMSLNTLGRRSVDVKSNNDDDGVSAPLSPAEFRAFLESSGQDADNDGKWDNLPVSDRALDDGDDDDDDDYDVPWASSKENSENAWLEDILPSDLAPPRPLNRREAKRIPKELLHHNNMSLLRRYVTPGGQIMNRVQSRLGAKDQRKIAKLIKRARHLGIMPFLGQWKYEDHGNVLEEDIDEDREWEKELKKRGLVIDRSKQD